MASSQIETALGNLAFATLKDKCPGALPYLEGFQMIDSNEDQTQCIGVFGFQIGQEWYFSPQFYQNGRLRGTELLYVKSQNAFVPFTEGWWNYLSSRKPARLGELEKSPVNQLGIREPDLSLYKSPNYKVASMLDEEGINQMLSALPFSPELTKSAERCSLPTFLKASNRAIAATLFKTMEDDEKFAEAVLSFYDIKDLQLPPADKAPVRKMTKAAEANAKVTIKTEDDPFATCCPGDPISSSDDKKRVKIKTTTLSVEDGRLDNELSDVYPSVDFGRALTNPDQPGVYKLLLRNGGMLEATIFQNPVTFSDYEDISDRSLVVDPKTNTYGNFHTSELFVFPAKVAEEGAWEKTFKGCIEADKMKIGKQYCLVNQHMTSTTPFTVRTIISGPDGRITLTTMANEYMSSSGGMHARPYCGHGSPEYDRSVRQIVLTGKDGNGMTHLGDSLYVADGFKAMELSQKFDSKTSLEPGTLGDVQETLLKAGELQRIKLMTDGVEWFITAENKPFNEPMSKDSAFRSLILQHGVRADVADNMIKSAQHRKTERYLIKYADGYPAFSTYSEPPTGYDGWAGVTTQQPFSQPVNVGMRTDNNYLYQILPHSMDPANKQMAYQAAATGQKEVFDTSVLSGLVKNVDADNMVDQYLGDMLLGLDRIGRILFVFYWHNDKFKERYGQQDMPELEDQLRNVFKGLGDLTLFLKMKTVESEPGQSEAEVDLDSTVGGDGV